MSLSPSQLLVFQFVSMRQPSSEKSLMENYLGIYSSRGQAKPVGSARRDPKNEGPLYLSLDMHTSELNQRHAA